MVRAEGAERRVRRWRSVAETLELGASVALVARAHGVKANQVFAWSRAIKSGELAEPTATAKEGGRPFESGQAIDRKYRPGAAAFLDKLSRMVGPWTTEELEQLRSAARVEARCYEHCIGSRALHIGLWPRRVLSLVEC